MKDLSTTRNRIATALALAIFALFGFTTTSVRAAGPTGDQHGVAHVVAQMELEAGQVGHLLGCSQTSYGQGIPEQLSTLTINLSADQAALANQLQAVAADQTLSSLQAQLTSSLQLQSELAAIRSYGDTVSIARMFEMQIVMNHLSQMSEMSASVVSAAEAAIASMARGTKGA